MRLLMLGWEFPPFISGGLGTACYGLVRALGALDLKVLFVLPISLKKPETLPTVEEVDSVQFHQNKVIFKRIPSQGIHPYPTSRLVYAPIPTSPISVPTYAVPDLANLPSLRLVGTGAMGGYDGDLINRIQEYADRCLQLTRYERFDVIHAHDWMTFPAGMRLAARHHRPLVVHVHATEFDRSGCHVNQALYDVERDGMQAAVRVITVSHRTKRMIVEYYGIPSKKIRVVHNGIDVKSDEPERPKPQEHERTVLFLGRITEQKGPWFFIEAARLVLEKLENVRFIMAGWGDLGPYIIEQVAAMGLGHKIHFAGFLQGADVERAYRMSDVYVLPSVSEPFGLTVLEAIVQNVPVILSKTSGVAEVLPTGALKCDYWDTKIMADRIVAVLNHPDLAQQLKTRARQEIRSLTWKVAARKCIDIYREL